MPVDRGVARSREPPPRGWPQGFANGAANRKALAVMASLRGILPREVHALAWREGSARACLDEIKAGRAGSDADREWAARIAPERVEAAAGACGARMLTPEEEEYPPRLVDLDDPPAALFVRGRNLEELVPRIGVVGARNCSPAGREFAIEVGSGLGAAGVCVVSGAARGVDSAAHQGSLRAGGTTIAVLGSGIDVAYPRGSRRMLEDILESGSIVSEYAPGVPAEPFRFPARNRIVAGLSEAVVVVEGIGRSGSLITAEHALEIGRSVFAVPGPVTSELAEAPLALIRDGATMIRGVADLLADLGYDDPMPGARRLPLGLSDTERLVLETLAGRVVPSTLVDSTGLAFPEVMATLLSLELRGLARNVGGRFERSGHAP
ncbi:MAG TPA: DNA-processing protein DprA [Actinomycetota bacterium]|nr:DNA-processing protein DprA [Actinomycetota bacterium]